MEQWEYTSTWASFAVIGGWTSPWGPCGDLRDIAAHLNEFGKEGWELASTHYVEEGELGSPMHHFFFKRRLDPAQGAKGGAGDESAD